MAKLEQHSSFYQRLEKTKQQLTRLSKASFWPLAALFVVSLVLLLMGRTRMIGAACLVLSILVGFADRYVDKTRNAVSNAWLRESLGRDSRAPVLIIRSFDTQGAAYRPPRQVGKARLSGESYFDEAKLASLGPLIAIGTGPHSAQPPTPPDVLYLYTEQWFEVFKLTSEAAQAIICAPGVSEGFVRELSILLQSKSIAKIVFFMPPTPAKARGLAAMSAKVSPFLDPGQVRKKWAELREFWEKRGLALPDYNPSGQVFVLENEEGAISSMPLDAGPDLLPKELAKQIKQLFGRMPQSPTYPISELLQKTRSFEVPMRGTWLYRLLCKPE